jgi:hypothetical protein
MHIGEGVGCLLIKDVHLVIAQAVYFSQPPIVMGLARRRTYKTHMPQHTRDGCTADIPGNVRMAGEQMFVNAINR